MPKIYFDERIAAGYDADSEMFDPAVVDPAVRFLAEQRLDALSPTDLGAVNGALRSVLPLG